MAYSSKHKRGVTWESPINSTSFFENDEWWVQYPVIYADLSRLNRCNSFSRCRAIVVSKRRRRRRRRSQKIDDLPFLATWLSGTKRCFPANLTILLPMEALDNVWYGSWRPLTYLTRTFRACHLCTLNVAAIFFRGHPYIWRTTVRHDTVRHDNEVSYEYANLVMNTY